MVVRRSTWSVALVGFGLLSAGCIKDGGFSFTPPKGWQEKNIPGLKYKAHIGPPSHGFAPNINVLDDSFSGSLNEYIDGNAGSLKKAFPNLKEVRRHAFSTRSGVQGMKLVTNNNFQGKNLRQTAYFFANGSKKYVVTCSCAGEDARRLEPVFDEAMATFQFN
jgi:hypothetical protein